MAKSESTKIEFGYFHDYESEQFAFYRIPKVLFTDEYFCNLSSDAKVLYGVKYPYQFVKSRLLLLEESHIEYVLDCLHENTREVKNIKAYLLTCLMNSITTIGNYYQAKVNHDMYGGGI